MSGNAPSLTPTDRVVIVTGGGQGIGRTLVHALSAVGALPVAADINGDAADRAAAEAPGEAMAATVDVADPASVDALIVQVLQKYGRIDGLVNNAALFSTLKMRPFDEIPLDEWSRVLTVNVTGPYLCARAVAPYMRDAQFGRIINISSGAVTLGRPNYLHYTTSKSALIGMTRSLARELGPHGVTVNSVLPGSVETEIPRETVTETAKAAIIAMQCIPRRQLPDDLVGAVLFLLSDASAFMTGQALTVDGGATHP
ncbi:MAG: SDR family oxidoreductase [Alphaproteobacteria bacterium]